MLMKQVSSTHRSANDFVNEDLCNLNSWLQTNKLSLNAAKTQCLVIGSRKRLKDIIHSRVAKSALVVSDENMSMVDNIKCFRVIVDRHLSRDEQLSAVTRTV